MNCGPSQNVNLKHDDCRCRLAPASNPTAADVFKQMRWWGLIAANYFPFQSRRASGKKAHLPAHANITGTWNGFRIKSTHSPRHPNWEAAQRELQDLRPHGKKDADKSAWHVRNYVLLYIFSHVLKCWTHQDAFLKIGAPERFYFLVKFNTSFVNMWLEDHVGEGSDNRIINALLGLLKKQ